MPGRKPSASCSRIRSSARTASTEIRQAVLLLVGQGTCRPCLPAAGEADRRARARAYNGAVAERAIDTDDPVYLASGTTGGGLSIDRVNCLVWLARHRKAADIQGFVWDALERSGQRLTKDGTSLDTREAATGVIAAAVASFDETLAPVFANLGIS